MQNYQPLDEARLRAALATETIGHTIHYTAATPSTMLTVHQAAAPTRHGLMAVTEEQTAGRGRSGRGWHAPPGQSILTSILLSSLSLQNHIAQLPMICGLAALEAIEAEAPALHTRLGLKWPNDLVMHEPLDYEPLDTESSTKPAALGKFGGILIESVFQSSTQPDAPTGADTGQFIYAVVGFGINVNQRQADLPPIEPPALPPTSLRLGLAAPLDRTALLIALCRTLSAYLENIHRSETLYTAWRERLVWMNQPIQVYPRAGKSYAAVPRDVTFEGDLVVEDEHGTTHILTGADVSIRAPHD